MPIFVSCEISVLLIWKSILFCPKGARLFEGEMLWKEKSFVIMDMEQKY